MKGRHSANLSVIEGGNKTSAVPSAPAGLSADAISEWERVAPLLMKAGLLQDEALASLEIYCVSYAGVRDCEKILTSQGRIFKMGEGPPKAHPAVRMQLQYLETCRRLAESLGLTALAKHRLNKTPTPGDDDGAPAGLDL